jgi:hypothetical protein
MNTGEFVQFSMSDGYWWVWRPIIANKKKIGYRKLRIATPEEIEGEMPKTLDFEDDKFSD